MLIIIAVVLVFVIFPRIPDKVVRGWNPLVGDRTASVKASVLILIDMAIIGIVFTLCRKLVGK